MFILLHYSNCASTCDVINESVVYILGQMWCVFITKSTYVSITYVQNKICILLQVSLF